MREREREREGNREIDGSIIRAKRKMLKENDRDGMG